MGGEELRIETGKRALVIAALAALLCGVVPAGLDAGSEPHGEADFTAAPNRLIDESSPYLLLHARNPVDWYPWGEEALERARREGKPIFLSVGYSTCYWCHVMEREVFSDPAIAALMNRLYVNIKVDREERPELDEIYMTATQLLTGSGGWPNSVFLTPELEPFFAGTYFPPENRHGRPGFPTVLEGIRDAWENRRSEVEARSKQVAAAIRQVIAEEREPAPEPPAPAAAEQVAAALKRRFDPDHGGFGGPPKFPSPGNLLLAWHLAERGDAEARTMVLETLERMGRGAIYDQLDGGFHRYTLDADWRIPHFEKMLYDNAHLAELLAAAWGAERDPRLERLVRGTLDFVLAEMTLAGGGFKSAIDAETDGEEGAFYTWTGAELRTALGAEGFELLAPVFALDGPPNFEGEKYTLYLARPLDEVAAERRTGIAALLRRLEPHLDRLAAVRRQRPFPLVDDKVLTDWNGMMIRALARAGSLLGERRYVEAAERAARFLLAELRDRDGALLHAWRAGEAKIPAFLDDYAYLLRGLLALDRATGDPLWLGEARRLAEEMEARLGDPAGGYFATVGRPDLLFRPKTITDGAVPSGNGIATLGLVELAERTGEEVYRLRAERALRAFAPDLERYGAGVPVLALATLRFHEAAAGSPRAAAARAAAEPAPRPAGTPQDLARRVVRARASRGAGDSAAAWRPLEVRLEIAPGWHVNANPASLDFLIATAVRGSVRGLVYPPGEALRFAFAEEELAVYGGSALIRGEVEAGAETVELLYQACDDRRCLPPVTLGLALEPADD